MIGPSCSLSTSSAEPPPADGLWRRRCDADVFVPEVWMFGDERAEHVDAFLRSEVDNLDSALAKPIDPALEVDRLADHDLADSELADESAAVPAGGEGCDHDLVAVVALPAGVPEGVCFAVDGRIVVLDAAVVSASEKGAVT